MSCGCGKKGVVRRTPMLRATVGPKSIKSAGATPLELRALGLQQAVSLSDSRSLDAQRRRIEKLRRDAIRDAIKRKLNK